MFVKTKTIQKKTQTEIKSNSKTHTTISLDKILLVVGLIQKIPINKTDAEDSTNDVTNGDGNEVVPNELTPGTSTIIDTQRNLLMKSRRRRHTRVMFATLCSNPKAQKVKMVAQTAIALFVKVL